MPSRRPPTNVEHGARRRTTGACIRGSGTRRRGLGGPAESPAGSFASADRHRARLHADTRGSADARRRSVLGALSCDIRLGHLHERIGRRFRGIIPSDGDGLHDERGFVRQEPRLDLHHAARVRRDAHPTLHVSLRRACDGFHPTADALELSGSGLGCHVEQLLLIRRRGSARHGAHFRIWHFATRECLIDFRQFPERLGHPHLLTRRDWPEPHPPPEPRHQRRKPITTRSRASSENERIASAEVSWCWISMWRECQNRRQF